MTIDIVKLKAAAEKAQAARARLESGPDESSVSFGEDDIKSYISAYDKFIAAAHPGAVLEVIAAMEAMVAAHVNLALLADVYRQAYEEALEHYKPREARVIKLVLDNERSWGMLCEKLEAAEKRIAELEARTVKLPAFEGYQEHIVRELQGAFRIACGNTGINLETGGEA